MALTAVGLIIREHPIGEADRFVTVLTDTLGVIRASVRGARRVNSRAGASTRLLAYSRLSLIKGRDKYIIDTAVPERVFFTSGGSIEQLSLAQYFCELFGAVAPREDEAGDYLRLLLNALHLLEANDADRDRIKAVAELRLMAMAGYLPDLHACRCGKAMPPLSFQPLGGVLCCAACDTGDTITLTPTVYEAMRHVLYGDPRRAFAFRLPEGERLLFSCAAERFVTCQLSRRFGTLEFYHGLSTPLI